MYKKILVPLDGSKIAQQVLPSVADMAKAFGSEVLVVGVCEPEETESGSACRSYVNNEAETLRAKTGDVAGSSVRAEMLSGKAAREILAYAEKEAVNLIIMASHGRSGIIPWSLGSTVNQVIHERKTPLIVVKAREDVPEIEDIKLFRRILVPLDGSENGSVILPYAVEIARNIDAEIVLMRVIEVGKHVHSIGGLDYIPYKDQKLIDKQKEAEDYLNKISEQFAGAKNPVRIEVRSGESARVIIKAAEDLDCRLIALSTHGHSNIETWVFGSAAATIVHSGRQSIMIVPPSQKIA